MKRRSGRAASDSAFPAEPAVAGSVPAKKKFGHSWNGETRKSLEAFQGMIRSLAVNQEKGAAISTSPIKKALQGLLSGGYFPSITSLGQEDEWVVPLLGTQVALLSSEERLVRIHSRLPSGENAFFDYKTKPSTLSIQTLSRYLGMTSRGPPRGRYVLFDTIGEQMMSPTKDVSGLTDSTGLI